MNHHEIALNVCREFTRRFEETAADQPFDEDADMFLQVLAVKEWQLKRAAGGMHPSVAYIAPLRAGIKEAEALLQSLQEKNEMDSYRLVWAIVMEFVKEIVQIEEAYGIQQQRTTKRNERMGKSASARDSFA